MSLAVIAIGRDEGERLRACLEAALAEAERVIYVDSGSSDGSVALARRLGAEVVELDKTQPFTAARARNAGLAALAEAPPELVQFVDGDCALEPGWLSKGRTALEADPTLGMVTGWRRERRPERNIYHRMAEAEWQRPPGPTTSNHGDMLVRHRDLAALDGFDGSFIASEDDEFCLRLAEEGRGLLRLPAVMTWHDIDMTRIGQWWRRMLRAGHGLGQIAAKHRGANARERARAWGWGFTLPLVTLAGLAFTPWALLLLLAWPATWAKTALGLRRRGLAPGVAARMAGFYTLAKVPTLIGLLTYHRRRLTGRAMGLIEYK
ncbi:glycosyltransferase [Pseudoroseicyclus tamaricis]|uniref:Glycosyltransferase family 2 protein n=1 Tax=Pseudoroseicyclus tamaricis TaxID=2705421 RepID=A0A6B2JNH7_9RHOB|nr:glycosyltransferase family A protein [Pseudoroseicyclus tamaricis]NDU99474.1 glycosyltransferase family 2 protein [Pseudoroseicyclus tamaricis]